MSVILLHSKYSESCKQLSHILAGLPLPFQIQSLCVDTKIVKDRIRHSPLDIKHVPCLLVPTQDGRLEKYEAQLAFQWVDNLIKQLSPPPQPTPSPPPQQVRRHIVEDLSNHEEFEEEEEEHLPPPSPPKPKRKNKKVAKATRIDEIPLDDTDTDLLGTDRAEPLDTIVSNIQGPQEEEEEADQVSRIRNRNNKKTKSSGILQMAQEMQKSRETIEPKLNKLYDN